MEIILQKLTCKRCKHIWIPRVISAQCPRCKSYKWNEEVENEKVSDRSESN